MHSAQQALIDKFTEELTDFFIITNASLSPDDQSLAKKLPALVVSPMDTKNEQHRSLNSDFIIIEQAYALTVIIEHETDAISHEQTEKLGGGLMLDTIKSAIGFRPKGFSDSFVLVTEFNPAPVYLEEQGMAIFTRAVKILEIIDFT